MYMFERPEGGRRCFAAAGLVAVVLASVSTNGRASGNVFFAKINQQGGSEGDTIEVARLRGSQRQSIVMGGLVDPYGIALDRLNGRVFWSEVNADVIKCANFDGTGVTVVLSTGPNPVHLAVDPIDERIYWGEDPNGDGDRIMTAKVDGSDVREVVPPGPFTGLLGLALDRRNGKLYWSDRGSGQPSKIGRVNVDGSGFEVLIGPADALSDAAGIALDLENEHIYWVDAGTNKIMRADLDGTNMLELPVTGLDDPHDLALDLAGGKMYWTDFGTNLVQRANLDGSDVEVIADTGDEEIRGLALIPGTAALGSCDGDPNLDGTVDFADILAVLEAWGSCP